MSGPTSLGGDFRSIRAEKPNGAKIAGGLRPLPRLLQAHR